MPDGGRACPRMVKRTPLALMVEPKGIDAETASNFVHLIMASNESWVVPAGFGERRLLVLDGGDAQRTWEERVGPHTWEDHDVAIWDAWIPAGRLSIVKPSWSQ